MDETKRYHSEISYENTAGLLSVNLYTKRVLYTGNTITMGSNLHNMNVSLVYNSLFELPFSDETGLGKKWKLDVEEYLYEYSDFYIYVDGLGSKHKFIKLKENKYYDESGLGYILDTSNGCVIKDIKGNELRFENNHLTEVITVDGVDIAYEYVGDLLVKMYSKNNDRNEIVFKYNKDNLLSSISKCRLGQLKERYKYYYLGTNNLQLVTKCEGLKETELLFFKYEDDQLINVTNMESEECLNLEILSENSFNISKGLPFIENQTVAENINYVGDEIYFDEDVYLGETASVEKKETKLLKSFYSCKITFNSNNTVVNQDGKEYTYFLDTEGKTVSIFNTENANNYKSFSKHTGICFTIDTGNFKIDNCNTINTTATSLNKSMQNEVVLEYDNYLAYLWIKKTNKYGKNKIALNLFDKNNNLIKSSTVKLNLKALNVWQLVVVPFTGVITKELKKLEIEFNDSLEAIDISDVILAPSNFNEILLKYDDNEYNINDFEKVYYDIYNEISFSNITLTDIFYNCLEEYKQIKNNTPTRGFYVDNLTKCVEGSSFSLQTNTDKRFLFKVRPEKKGEKELENKYEFPYVIKSSDNSIFKKYFVYLDHDLYNTGHINDYIVEKTMTKLTGITSCIYNYYDMNGKLLLSEDEYGVQTRYSYTNNSRNVVLRNKNLVSGEVLSSSETWDDNSITKTEGELISNIKFDEVTNLVESIENEMFDNDGNTISSNKREYSYVKMQNSDNNSLRAKYDNIKILNGIDTIYENRIYYDKKDRVYEIINRTINGTINGTNSYKYAYYNNNGELCEIKENDQIERYYTYKTVNGITERKNKNETIIELDSVGKVDTVKRNGYIASEDSMLYSNKIPYFPDVSIKRNDESKEEAYVNNYKADNLSNSSSYKRKYDKITPSGITTKKEIIVNKRTNLHNIKYISCHRTGTNQYVLSEENDIGESYIIKTVGDANVKVNPRTLETNTFIGIGNVLEDRDNIGLKTEYEYDSIGRIKRKNIRTNIVGDAPNEDVKVSKKINYMRNTSLVSNEEYYINKVSEETPCINIAYNIKGTLDSYTITDKDNNQQICIYSYDTKNQLCQEVNDGITKTYGYDNNGNITRKEVTNNDINSVYEYVYTNNRLTSINKDNELYCELAYDTIGNCTRYIKNNENNVLTWNYGNKLVQFTTNNSTSTNTTKYDYNIDGKRVQKVLNDGTYIDYYYEGNTLLWEYRTKEGLHTKISYIYDQEGISGFGIQDFINNNGPATVVYKYIKDRLGNVIGITDGNNLLAKYKYDAWGNHKVYDGLGNENDDVNFIGNINPIRYRGYYYDVETGLFWLSSRYYSPELCRFISPDDIEYLDPESVNGMNLYCYCKNNPIMYADPSGHFTIAALLISIGISLAFEVVEDLMGDGKLGGDKDGWDYLGAGIAGFFGGLGGRLAAQAIFSVAGGLADAAISGDLVENGFWSTMGSIALSTAISFGAGALSRKISNNIQIKKLNTDPFNNRNVVRNLGVNYSFKNNGKSVEAAVKAIKNGNWISKTLWEGFSSNLGGSTTSFVWGLIF